MMEFSNQDWEIKFKIAAFLVKALTAYSSLCIDFLRFVIKPLLLAYCSSVYLSNDLMIASAFSISFVKSDHSTDIFSLVVCFTLKLLTFSFKITSTVFSLVVWSLFLLRQFSIFYFKVVA